MFWKKRCETFFFYLCALVKCKHRTFVSVLCFFLKPLIKRTAISDDTFCDAKLLIWGIFLLFQNLKDQILTTNVWLEHVSILSNKGGVKRRPKQKLLK